jgi:hypothetical protein
MGHGISFSALKGFACFRLELPIGSSLGIFLAADAGFVKSIAVEKGRFRYVPKKIGK